MIRKPVAPLESPELEALALWKAMRILNVPNLPAASMRARANALLEVSAAEVAEALLRGKPGTGAFRLEGGLAPMAASAVLRARHIVHHALDAREVAPERKAYVRPDFPSVRR